MSNRHNEFVDSLRNILKREEKMNTKKANNNKDYDEDARNLQELLETKFDELFGPADNVD